MLLEVIATTVKDAVIAERYGADRIELITGIREGGLTPSLGLIEEVREAVRIPVRVMVRPHARSFQYEETDVQTMLRDIRHIAAVGGLSLVMGMLRSDRTVDEELLKRLLQAADGMDVTFHRAYDEAQDQLAALEVLSRYPQITDILTSGGRDTAPEGAERIAVLERLSAASPISILAGSGLTAEGLSDFVTRTAVSRVHFGSAVREDGDPLKPIDPARLQAVCSILNSGKR
ncbi:copper homeostasis protein CutC [Paenibacillus riograndensis]|uniref:PF03932 family protein CutC n=1 Tax=Paenibacillus riograndensis SBR5 TaxID=1073571 RepID=A0A0E3WGL8_9BACL|nr:copper homeostasis protein CutC [Paenibacillus riograndensis]CQR53392.1 CutC family protein [Paenibacillus riograndensis SBR5]